ncbi:MAG: Fe-S cluster assembly protein SufD [Thermoanaerobaculia bacterium]|nr:Fe-S cluster assembly protein SufD [Thermoanaerobaculia bacterium]
MTEILATTDSAVDRIATLHAELAGGPVALQTLRADGLARFRELGFPTTKQEEWIYTNVAPIARMQFRLAERRPALIDRAAIESWSLAGEAAIELVFVDGHYSDSLSRVFVPSAVTARSLAAMLAERAELVASHLAARDGAFTALNAAFLHDGAYLAIPEGKVIDRPIHLLFVSTQHASPQMTSPRVVVLAGRSSEVKIVESYVSIGEATYFTNAVTEIVAGENSRVDHTRVQLESESAFHVSLTSIQQARDSRVFSHAIQLGGSIVRNEIHATLDGEGSECRLDGLFVLRGSQHVDNHTVIDHAKPHATSEEFYKGVLDGRSRGIFDGKIVVRKDAQKTSSRQTNNNLLLSNEAIIDSKPQLEILADDVKCTHGSTIGQIDEEALFYLQSRGVGRTEARGILTFAFASEIVGRLEVETLKSRLETALLGRIPAPSGASER